MEPAFTWIASYGYVAIFGLLVLGIVGLPVPNEALLTFVGYLNSRRDLTLLLSMHLRSWGMPPESVSAMR